MERSILGDTLRKARRAHDLSQKELAAETNVGYPAVARLETDPEYAPYWETVRKLAKRLGLSLDALAAAEEAAAEASPEQLAAEPPRRPRKHPLAAAAGAQP